MSEAISFTIGGNNEALIGVLKDSEMRVNDYAKTIRGRLDNALTGGKGFESLLEGERRVKTNIRELTATLLSGGSAADIAAAAVVRLGESFKIGLGGAVGLAVFYEAFSKISESIEKVKELDEQLEKLEKHAGGQRNIALVSQEDISDKINQANQLQQKSSEFYQSPISVVSDFLGETYKAFTAPLTGRDVEGKFQDRPIRAANAIEESGKENREKLIERRKLEAEYAQKISDGDKEGAALFKIKLDYATKIAQALQLGGLELAKQVQAEQSVNELMEKRSARLAESERKFRVSESDAQETLARNAVNQSPEQIQRSALNQRIASAETASQLALEKKSAYPDDKDAAANLAIAENQHREAVSNLAKFEKDIKIQKAEELSIARAQYEATADRLKGEEDIAKLTLEQAENQKYIAELRRQGHDDIADTVEATSKLNQILAAIKPASNSDKPKTAAEIAQEQRAEQRKAQKNQRAEDRIAANDYITRAQRDSDGNIIGGYDILSRQNIQRDPLTGDIYSVGPDGKRGEKIRGAMTPYSKIPPDNDPSNKRLPPVDPFGRPYGTNWKPGQVQPHSKEMSDSVTPDDAWLSKFEPQWHPIDKNNYWHKAFGNTGKGADEAASIQAAAAASQEAQAAIKKAADAQNASQDGGINGIYSILKSWDRK